MSFSKKSLILCLTALPFASSCSDKSSDESSDFVIAESAPTDSTGASGTMSMSFASLNSLGLRLTADTATSVTIGTDIVLNYAKFNLAKVRVKALKERTEEEKTLETIETTEEKAAVKEVESETEATAAELTENGNKSTKDKKADRAGKIKAKADRLDAKEKSAITKESGRDKSTKWAGPFIYDAIAGTIVGDAPAATLVDGSYRRVEFQMKRNFSAAEGEAILGNVFAMKGTVLKAGVAIPFEIDWHAALNFRLTGEGAMKVTAGADNAMVIDFNLAKWFDGIDLTTATVDTDGTIYINKSSNRLIMKKLHSNIKTNSRFGKDADGDKKLNTEEKAGAGEDTVDAVSE